MCNTLHKRYYVQNRMYIDSARGDEKSTRGLDMIRLRPLDYLYLHKNAFSSEQSARSVSGRSFENQIEELLIRGGIPFRSQVPVSRKSGVIADIRPGRRGKNLNYIDFVVGNGITKGKHIRNFGMLSVKTTARERFGEDDQMLMLGPARCYLVVLKNPPAPERYENNASVRTRIVTDHPNKRDSRQHKLTMSDMIAEIVSFVSTSTHPK